MLAIVFIFQCQRNIKFAIYQKDVPGTFGLDHVTIIDDNITKLISVELFYSIHIYELLEAKRK